MSNSIYSKSDFYQNKLNVIMLRKYVIRFPIRSLRYLQRLMKICDFTNVIQYESNLHESLEKNVYVVWKNQVLVLPRN